MLEEELFALLRSIIKKMRKILEREISVFGIGHAEMRLLMFLYESDGCNQDELSAKIEVDRSNTGRALKKLETLQYIERKKSEQDGRAFTIFLTSKAWEVKDHLYRIKNDLEKTIAHGAPVKEIRAMIPVLKRLDASITDGTYNRIKHE